MKACCAPFAKAQEENTDNEGYMSLIDIIDKEREDWNREHPEFIEPGVGPYKEGDVFIGTGLPKIKFCPWCGTEIK